MNTINSKQFIEMLLNGGYYLKTNSQKINDLNVFPVPDGDTGSNMSSTYLSGIKEIYDLENETISEVAHKFSRGLLLGARGNSGVILSQIFSGLSSSDENNRIADIPFIIDAFEKAKEQAYRAVVVPVEGTILTVINEATKAVRKKAKEIVSIEQLAEVYLEAAEKALESTPELLPVLKEAGVVDSGGAGYVEIIRGFAAYFRGENHTIDEVLNATQKEENKAKNYMDYSFYELNQYGYCTEFSIRLNPNLDFNKELFSKKIEVFGNSIVVVMSQDIVKVHIHTKIPGEVFSFAQQYGALCAVKADNMAIQTEENSSMAAQKVKKNKPVQEEKEEYGIVAVLNGDGLVEIFKELGVNEVIDGGQTMNPSTKDFMDAIENVNAKHVFVIPNNKNVYLSAKTAKALINDKHVIVVPAKTIAQGYAALMAFDQTESAKDITKDMESAISNVESGEITYAVRDSLSSGIEIKKGDFISILDGKIISSMPTRIEALKDLVSSMINQESSTVTIFYGSDVSEQDVAEIQEYMDKEHDMVFTQMLYGGQDIYSFIIEVE